MSVESEGLDVRWLEEIEETKRKLVKTEKGISEQKRIRKNRQTAGLSALTKQRNEITELMNDRENLHLVKSGLEDIVSKFDFYEGCYGEHMELVDEANRTEEERRFQQKENSFMEFKEQVVEWIHRAETELGDQFDQRSGRSSSSSTRAAFAHEQAKLAELRVEKKLLQMRLEQRRKSEELDLEIKITKAEARSAVYAGFEHEDRVPVKSETDGTKVKIDTDHIKGTKVQPPIPMQTLSVQATPFVPVSVPTMNYVPTYTPMTPMMDPNSPMIAQMLETQRHLHLPAPKVPKFSGDPIDYVSFIMAFDARILPHVTTDVNRLYYLDQQLEGEAKDLIQGCLFMDADHGYQEARRLLAMEFGDSFKISTAYLKKATNWPVIRPDEGHGLKQLSYFLTRCLNAMTSISHMSVLNHAPNMQLIVLKLPVYLQNKWRDHASKLRHRRDSVVFKDLVDFVVLAADSANDPVYSREALGQKTQKPVKRKENTSSSFVTNVDTPDRKCYVCQKNHDIDICEEFKGMSLEDRRSHLQKRKMCFGCYGFNHFSKGCTRKRVCQICKRKHPTALHDPNFRFQNKGPQPSIVQESTTETTSSCMASASDSSSECVLQAILPVKVKQAGSGKLVETYALYDNGSSGCFITEDLRDKLQAKNTKTTLKLQTLHGAEFIQTSVVSNLEVTDLYGNNTVKLPKCYTRQEIPVDRSQIPRKEVFDHFTHLSEIADKVPPYFHHLDVGLLIGTNCPKALQPLRVIPMEGDGPYAVLYNHGWTINGPVRISYNTDKVTCNRILFQEMESFKECEVVAKMFELDFNERQEKVPGEKGLSMEDHKFLKIAENSCRLNDGHHELLLPFRENNPSVPNNREQAMSRLNWQKKKMKSDAKYHEDYTGFIKKIIDKGYAYEVPEERLQTNKSNVWYLPHHGVYHAKKNKIRVVFDCSAKYQGLSLNDRLLQGPDLTNSLLGVLSQFRVGSIAFMGDIESMFYQVRVPEHQHDYLRFLWWCDGDYTREVREYCMSVHIFGAASSPSIANYALRATAQMAEEKGNVETANIIRRNFYVDDCLKAVDTEEQASQMIQQLRDACAEGGFNLTKFTSNSKEVLKNIPEGNTSTVLDLDLDKVLSCNERALGTQWSMESDTIGFSIQMKDKPSTRRGLLSTIASVYDPLGIAAPFVMPAKKLLQELCKNTSLGWDDEISEEQTQQWTKWKEQLPELENVKVKRCLIPREFASPISNQLHVFSDASTQGYGSVAYIRSCDRYGNINVTFMMGKARVAPMKIVSIPRLELTAATVSVKLGTFLTRELSKDIQFKSVQYYTDSMTVLRYINNEKKRFPVFVSIRVRLITDFSEKAQWKYIETKNNPADCASRGMKGKDLAKENLWLQGPEFLRRPEEDWPKQPTTIQDEDEDESETSAAVSLEKDPVATMMEYFSDWFKLKKAVAVLRRFLEYLQSKVKKCKEKTESVCKPIDAEDLQDAEYAIVKYVQKEYFNKEVTALRSRQVLTKRSSIFRLDPYLDEGNDVLRVGGRLRRSTILQEEAKHPMLLPYKHHVTQLVIQSYHSKLGHVGRNHTLAAIRGKYWIIKGNSAVRAIISKCVKCRKTHFPVTEQKMADLPEDRVNPSPPFAVTGIDAFGPFVVKEGRKTMKRYGIVFTCLACRAIHLETVNSLETDSFLQALRRFIARRGNVKIIRCDNGTNFVGASNELKKCMDEINGKVNEFLQKQEIKWIFNPPGASNMGGIWERQIRTVRKILSSLLIDYPDRMDDETLRTLLCEVEAIVNSRPLTPASDSPDDLYPLTPNHALGIETGVIIPPPGNFQRDDMYSKKRWRRVQFLAQAFWNRWKREFLMTLQERSKWNKAKRNMEVNDVVLIKDENSARNQWLMGKVIETEKDDRKDVRGVVVKTKNGLLRRPVNKLVMLLPVEEQ